MGVYYYAVIPKLKLLLWLGRNIHEDCLEEDERNLKDIFSMWHNHNEGDISQLSEIKDKSLKNFKVEDLMSIAFYISKIEIFLYMQNYPEVIIRYLLARNIDKNSYVISDSSDEINKLRKKNYKTIEEDDI